MKVELENVKPMDIEKRSFEIITKELGDTPLIPGTELVVKRCIHTSADFDYAKNLCFSDHAVEKAIEAIKEGACIVTDTQMAKAGINKKALARYGGEVYCFMSDEDVAKIAKENGSTRATASMDKAAGLDKKLIFAIGNAPTALVRLYELIEDKNKAGADYWRARRLCQCGSVKRADYGNRSSVYCCQRTKGRLQYCGLHLQCTVVYD